MSNSLVSHVGVVPQRVAENVGRGCGDGADGSGAVPLNVRGKRDQKHLQRRDEFRRVAQRAVHVFVHVEASPAPATERTGACLSSFSNGAPLSRAAPPARGTAGQVREYSLTGRPLSSQSLGDFGRELANALGVLSPEALEAGRLRVLAHRRGVRTGENRLSDQAHHQPVNLLHVHRQALVSSGEVVGDATGALNRTVAVNISERTR